MEKCSDCGRELNALNMSDDDESLCQDCAAEIINKLEPIEESPEIEGLTDRAIDRIIDGGYKGLGYRW